MPNSVNIIDFFASLLIVVFFAIVANVFALPFTIGSIFLLMFFNKSAPKEVCFDGEYVLIKRYFGQDKVHISKCENIVEKMRGIRPYGLLRYINSKNKNAKILIYTLRYKNSEEFILAFNKALEEAKQ